MTLVAYGAMVAVAERSAEALAGEATCEVLDLRTLKPLDEDALLGSVRKTGRAVIVQEASRTLGFAAEVAADPGREGDPRPARARPARDRLRRALPVLAARGLVHALARACRGRGALAVGLLDFRAGMAYEFKLPDLGEGLTEGEVARWLVEEGASIAEDDPLVEIQTDKATVEIPSPAAGTVLRILVPEGHVAPVGAVLVVIGDEGEQLLRSVAAGPADSAEPEPVVAVVPPEPLAAVRATPLVRRIAQELGVDLASVSGTGADGASHRGGRAQRSDGSARHLRGPDRWPGGRRAP